MSVSLKDISRAAHVNICAISWVLNNHPRAQLLRQETRDKILVAARQLGYCKNEMAASIARKSSSLFVFVTEKMGVVEYTGRILNGVLSASSAHGYTLFVLNLRNMTQDDVIHKILGWKASGVIFHIRSLNVISRIIPVLNQNQIPWGTVNLNNPGGLGITTDDSGGIYSAVHLLRKYGHRKIAFLAYEKREFEYQVNRLQGFRKGLHRYFPDIPEQVFNLPGNLRKGGAESGEAVLNQILEEKIDGVICESDYLANLLCNLSLARKVVLPEAFSVIGFGDLSIASSTYPALTSISQNFEKMGELLVSSLLEKIAKPDSVMQGQVLKVKICERDSVIKRF